MSKAYDLVNRENLWKAMRRIKIPDQFIKIIENSLKFRTNQVITDVGLTNEYDMNNGINQGEIMSPLLWIIYYDPVFSKIKKIKVSVIQWNTIGKEIYCYILRKYAF